MPSGPACSAGTVGLRHNQNKHKKVEPGGIPKALLVYTARIGEHLCRPLLDLSLDLLSQSIGANAATGGNDSAGLLLQPLIVSGG